ncbi:phosphomannomutase 2 [Pelobates cultripes]|uniref:Phosphomannomutase n=1 Tax=Pelobates cultripes TaxID=61616 RepID=A0AAD1SRD2_PELCU|nr:phosphomannomutase 2 [Pelobates cultripes]
MADSVTLCLFDVDGTLTTPRQKVTTEMADFLHNLRKRVKVGVVGGSDFDKIKEQLGEDGLEFMGVFAEGGDTEYKDCESLLRKPIFGGAGAEILSVNRLEERAKLIQQFWSIFGGGLRAPCITRGTGTFLQFRDGRLRIAPGARSCSQKRRTDYLCTQLMQKEHFRETFVAELQKQFVGKGLTFSIGGQISFDVFPIGWDKTYCLDILEKDGFSKIYFFGDKTVQGGNDYEIYTDARTIGYSVTSPSDTMRLCKELFFQ